MRKSKDGDMNEVNKYAHTHTRIQEKEKLKRGNGCSRLPFTSSTLLKQFSITSVLHANFRTLLAKPINTQQVNARRKLHITRLI